MSMKRLHTLLFPLFVLGAVVVAIVPLPAAALDVLLSAQLTTAVLVLLTAVYTPRPLEFSVFPSLLLGTTLGRLVLNIASTRLILTRGASEGTHAAGQVIAAFGQFVAGGELIVGLVVFLILVVVQFVVITKGASRISEVAARFMLDALPGRQAAIDADVRAGLVNQQQAARLRRELAEQADFYGAMDGASKFVRGDAVAGLVITAVNIAGGLTLGVLRHGMPLSEAAATFTTLTIGDGLVSQLPALLIAIAAALIATRSSTETELPRQITTQLSQHAEVLFLGAAFLVLLAATGLPALPLLLLAAGCAAVGLAVQRRSGTSPRDEAAAKGVDNGPPRSAPPPARAAIAMPAGQPPANPGFGASALEKELAVAPLEVRLGVGLLGLVDHNNGDLMHRIQTLRQTLVRELGFVLPKVKIRDDVRLAADRYELRIRGNSVATGSLRLDAWLAIPRRPTVDRVRGEAAGTPGLKSAVWITPEDRAVAEEAGYRVVPPATALLTHLDAVVRTHAAELLTRQQVHQLLQALRREAPTLVDEVLQVTTTADVHAVLQALLAEGVPIRDLERILETLVSVRTERSRPRRVELIRQALRRTICSRLADDGRLTVHLLTASAESALMRLFTFGEHDLESPLTFGQRETLRRSILEAVAALPVTTPPVVLCDEPLARAALAHLLRESRAVAAVISRPELLADMDLTVASPPLDVPLGEPTGSHSTDRAASHDVEPLRYAIAERR